MGMSIINILDLLAQTPTAGAGVQVPQPDDLWLALVTVLVAAAAFILAVARKWLIDKTTVTNQQIREMKTRSASAKPAEAGAPPIAGENASVDKVATEALVTARLANTQAGVLEKQLRAIDRQMTDYLLLREQFRKLDRQMEDLSHKYDALQAENTTLKIEQERMKTDLDNLRHDYTELSGYTDELDGILDGWTEPTRSEIKLKQTIKRPQRRSGNGNGNGNGNGKKKEV